MIIFLYRVIKLALVFLISNVLDIPIKRIMPSSKLYCYDIISQYDNNDGAPCVKVKLCPFMVKHRNEHECILLRGKIKPTFTESLLINDWCAVCQDYFGGRFHIDEDNDNENYEYETESEMWGY